MAVLLEVPLQDGEGGAAVLVEADRGDLPGGLVLASTPGEAAAKAARSLSASLEQLQPVLTTVRDKLVASAPEHFTVEFGVKLGGETGVIVAKGTAEVNLKITIGDPEIEDGHVSGYETAIVRLVRFAPGRPTAGVGVLIGTRQVVTCAHVVNACLGRNQRGQDRPGESDLASDRGVSVPAGPSDPVGPGGGVVSTAGVWGGGG